MWERKAAEPRRGGNPFRGERKGREGKRGLQSAAWGSHKKKTSQTTDWGARGTEWHRFFANGE